jgi:hypothetical protein
MNRFRQAWKDFTIWRGFVWHALKALGETLFYDAMIPDRPYSLTRRLFKAILWHLAHSLKVPWRECEPIWAGLKGCYVSYSACKRAKREYDKLVKRLLPLMERYGEPGETAAQFLDRIYGLARIGEQALKDKGPLAEPGGPVAVAEGCEEGKKA